MKVGIITLHRVVNYGSVLQAYATQEVLKKLGFETEIIDYYPPRMTKRGMLSRIRNKGDKFKNPLICFAAQVIIFPSYIKRFGVFEDFLKNRLHMSSKTYYKASELNDCKYDIYLTGSDQVWNSEWNECLDAPFYLSFAPDNVKKLAYAASFGRAKLDETEKEETRKLLERYDAISVREKSGVDVLKDMGLNGVNVLDPTLLLTGEEWNRISSKKYAGEKYILVYNLNRNSKIDKYAYNLSQKTGLKIKFLSYQLHEFYKKGQMICNPKVEDFLALIANAEYVITDSFHATAFSLNFQRKFVIVYPGKYSTRLQSILEILGLTDRVAKDESDLSVVDNNIDYAKVNQILSGERHKSIDWLTNALK